ncbi:MAG: helix-turn-helix domain-containing protein [Methylocystis sp.]|nr:helix-turn-helix domain-containing protein [Methylocystis sp.]
MTLAEYLSSNGISDAEFAARIGVDTSFVFRLRKNQANPSFKSLAAIEAATGGAVTLADFIAEDRAAEEATQ